MWLGAPSLLSLATGRCGPSPMHAREGHWPGSNATTASSSAANSTASTATSARARARVRDEPELSVHYGTTKNRLRNEVWSPENASATMAARWRPLKLTVPSIQRKTERGKGFVRCASSPGSRRYSRSSQWSYGDGVVDDDVRAVTER